MAIASPIFSGWPLSWPNSSLTSTTKVSYIWGPAAFPYLSSNPLYKLNNDDPRYENISHKTHQATCESCNQMTLPLSDKVSHRARAGSLSRSCEWHPSAKCNRIVCCPMPPASGLSHFHLSILSKNTKMFLYHLSKNTKIFSHILN